MRIHSPVKNPGKFLGLLTVAMLALNGCSHKSTGPLIPAPASPIADVPIPAGFEMNAGKSTSTVVPSNNFRAAYHVYTGDDDVLPVVNFYRTQMPTKDWTLLDQTQLKDEVTLRFNKNRESVAITVKKTLFSTTIIVKLGPSDAVSTPPK